VSDHRVVVPGGETYHRLEGSGPPLVLIGGRPSNADTLAALAGELSPSHTVITYDRRGYSRSRIDDPSQPATMSLHANDVRDVIDDVGARPASVFATSIGALIGLELAAADPGAVARVVVHEPPLGQLVAVEDRASFDVELFIRRDVPAIADYRLDLARLASRGRPNRRRRQRGWTRVLPPSLRRGPRRRAQHNADRASRQPRRDDQPAGRVRRVPGTAPRVTRRPARSDRTSQRGDHGRAQ
jgi:pimeloyl-ACP methyl ester carboxylesterase